jgi:hypothetical protein
MWLGKCFLNLCSICISNYDLAIIGVSLATVLGVVIIAEGPGSEKRRLKKQSIIIGKTIRNEGPNDSQGRTWFCLDCSLANPADIFFCGKCGSKRKWPISDSNPNKALGESVIDHAGTGIAKWVMDHQ